jgi:hypothetical protein
MSGKANVEPVMVITAHTTNLKGCVATSSGASNADMTDKKNVMGATKTSKNACTAVTHIRNGSDTVAYIIG